MAVNDATFSKWVLISPDLTSIQNEVNQALSTADSAVTEAQIANVTAAQANTLATQAQI